jgi:putative ABC transport system permease protein
MELIKQEIRYAIRILARNPLFAAVAILTLALGIGANSAIFSAVYNVLLKPLPYKDPDKLVMVLSTRKDGSFMTLSPADLQDYSKSGAFEQTAAFTTETLDLTGKGEPERLPTGFVSWNFFQTLGIQPVSGRGFLEAEGKYGAEKVVILGHGLWKRRFASDPRIVGSTVMLNGIPRTVIGIAPPGFEYPAEMQLWSVLAFSPDELDSSQRGAHWIRAIGRLAPGLTIEQANTRVRAVAADLAKRFPRSNEFIGGTVQPFHGFLVRKSKTALLVLWASVGFLLLIACVNVTNLLLAQAARRESEVAIRTALGAGRLRLFRQFLVESLVLSVAASVAGLVIGLWCTELLIRFGSASVPALAQLKLDSTVLIFTLSVSLLTGVLIGLIPAMQSVHKAMPQKLKSGVRVAGRNRVRRGLAIVEIATALILLAGAGLLIKSFYKLMQVDPGFRAKGVLSFEVSLPDATYSKPHQISRFYDDFIDRLKAHGEVRSGAAVFGLPLTQGYNASSSFVIAGKPAPQDEPTAGLRVITPEYFQTMGIPLINGRQFLKSDTDESGDVVIISQSAAENYFRNEDPIGQKIDIGVNLVERESQARTIVGVVGNVRFGGLETNPEPDMYIPHSQQPINAMTVVIRTSADSQNLGPIVREELRKMDSNLPVSNMQTMEEVIGDSLGQRKFTMFLLVAFAGVGLFLAALGTYGVLSFQVVQRTQEIGIRMALGARRSDVLKLVLQEGLFLAVAGTLIGFLGVLGTTRFLESLVYGISTLDGATFASVVILLSFVALLACYLPARRATKVDPITTLHYE